MVVLEILLPGLRKLAVLILAAAACALFCGCTESIDGGSSIWGDAPQTHDPIDTGDSGDSGDSGTTKSWKSVGSADFSASTVGPMAITIGPDDRPYVFFRDDYYGKGVVMSCVDGVWAYWGSYPVTDGGFSARPSIGFNSSGVLYVAYKDEANSNHLTVMYGSGSSWDVVGGTKGFSDGVVYDVSLAFDSLGQPCVAYRDENFSYMAIVRVWNGGSWDWYGATNGITTAGAYYTSLALCPTDGKLYIAYADETLGNLLHVMRYESGWVDVGTAGFSGGIASAINLAFDSTGIPYVAFQDGAYSSKATVMRYEGGAWSTVGSNGISAGTAAYVSLAINSENIPFVAYQDFSFTDYRATVLAFKDGAWNSVGSPGFTATGADWTCLDCTAAGAPLIAYINKTTSFANAMIFK